MVANGGTGKIKTGNAANEYKIVCKNQDLELYVNGSMVWHGTVSTSLPQYMEGYVGFGVSTDVGSLPAKMGFDWVKIEQP